MGRVETSLGFLPVGERHHFRGWREEGTPAAEAWDLDWTAWVWGPEPKWLFQASPLGVPEGPPL